MTSPSSSSSLLPAADIKEFPRSSAAIDIELLQAGLAIERPRSALHSGDFTQHCSDTHKNFGERSSQESGEILFSTTDAWLATSPPRHFTPFQGPSSYSLPPHPQDLGSRSQAPSLSSSFSSSFVFKAPTSPLVQSESNDDLDFSSSLNSIDLQGNSARGHRRSTYQSSYSGQSTPFFNPSSPFDRQLPSLRRDHTYPYQAHQPRRSLNSNQGLQHSQFSPQTPALQRSRRPSFSSDCSPLQHASMVGSYEESILRGRMSTTPSRPLDFVAQIGVLGLGKCKSSLRCPAHVTVPFPAVFYSYGNTSHGRTGKSEDGPSPYVGLIDLENGLQNQDDFSHESKRKRSHLSLEPEPSTDNDMFDPQKSPQFTNHDRRKAQKQKRRSTSPRSPPGGSYRIPEKGQLQIIIKNPNKTAVKLFLVPYDLAGMEPGTKTFIRQISYSAGPVIESAILSPQPPVLNSGQERQTLRYLLHLHICSPSRGRYYLYKSIRVVFANRVPDGKEKLKNEIKWPEPRWSLYKPGRESGQGLGHTSGPGASLAAEKLFRRRSSGFALSPSHRKFDAMDGIAQSLHVNISTGLPYQQLNAFSSTPIEPIPLSLFSREPRKKDEDSHLGDDGAQILSPTSSKSSQPPTSHGSGMSTSWNSSSTDIGSYDKLSKGDVGYGGNAFTGMQNGLHASSEGLLALKLKSLGVGKLTQEPE